MGDFNSCRFDFRIDTKSGLTPSRRKKAERKTCNYNTLFKCKTCGSLFENRPALLEHKATHSDFRCLYCDFKFGKRKFLDDHLRSVHGTYIKIAPKPDMSPPHEEDEIVMYPNSVSPGATEEDDEEIVHVPIGTTKLGSPPSGNSVVTSTSSHKSPSKLVSPSLPPLVSVNSVTEGSSPPLPSTTLISQAVRNVFSSITAPSNQTVTLSRSSPSPVATAIDYSSDKPSKETSSIDDKSVEAPAASEAPKALAGDDNPPALISPTLVSPQQPMFMSPMAAFPQIRYGIPQQVVPVMPQTLEGAPAAVTPSATPLMTSQMTSAVTPSMTPELTPAMTPAMTSGMTPTMTPGITPTMTPGMTPIMTPGMTPTMTPNMAPVMTPPQPCVSAQNPAPLPPGYVYINVPMYINPAQGNFTPQLLSGMQMPTIVPIRPQQPQTDNSQSQEITAEQEPIINNSSPESEPSADSTTSPKKESRRKRKRPAQIDLQSDAVPQKLVIQDPRSLSSTEFEGVKLEPTTPEEIDSQALDFSRKRDPVRQDVNISEASTAIENPLSSMNNVVDLCKSSSSSSDDMDFEDDKAAMLDEYRTDFSIMDGDSLTFNTEMDVSRVDADSTSQNQQLREDRGTPKDYLCDQCEFNAPNGAVLAQHKTKSHKVKTGLNKLLGKLWQHKMKKPESDSGQENEIAPKVSNDEQKEKMIEQSCIAITPTSAEFASADEVKVKAGQTNKQGAEIGTYTKFHTCKVCRRLFDDMNEMWEHMGTHGELRKFKCNMCNFKAVCRDRLAHHKNQEHPEYSKNPWTMPKKKEQPPTANTTKAKPQQGPKTKATTAKELSMNDSSKERYNCLLQCPEEGCSQQFLTIGGLKNHQVSHLEENCSAESNDDSTVYPCSTHRCGLTFADQASLEAHQASTHENAVRSIICPLCKYQCKHRSSMNWHMKSKHRLDKAKTATNRTIYINDDGKVVADNWLEESGESQVPMQESSNENILTPMLSPKEIQQSVEEAMHSMPDEHQRFVYNNIEGLGTPGVITYTDEPEEITIDPEGGPLTVDRLALHDKIKEQEDGKIEQPLDMSVKKSNEAEEVSSEVSHNSSSLDLSQYTGDVVSTLGGVPSGAVTPSAGSSCSTPVPKECKLEIDSISTPTEDMQHFTSVLKLKYVGAGANKERKKQQPSSPHVDTYPCQVCNEPFSDVTTF